MISRLTILTTPSMRAAVDAVTALEAAYLKANKRKMTVDLTVSSMSQPYLDAKKRVQFTPEQVEVRCVYDAALDKQAEEAAWFAENGIVVVTNGHYVRGGAK